jgi:ethanolamine utilization protein EutQ (cupin superfamily)
VSAQPGDAVYYSIAGTLGGFNVSNLTVTKYLGAIKTVTEGSVTVQYDDATVSAPPTGSFIFFQKDKKVNMSSILGYYAQVDFTNDSKEKAEIFSVGAGVVESSK